METRERVTQGSREEWPQAPPVDKAALLAALVEYSQDAIVAKTLDGIITYWNPAAEQLFGYTAAEAIGESILLLTPDDRRDEERRLLESLREGKPIAYHDTIRVRKNGTHLRVSLNLSPLQSSDGTVVGGATIARDMTARVLAEERFRLVFEAAPNSMLMIRADGKIVLANSSAEELFGYTRNELLEASLERLFPQVSRAEDDADRSGTEVPSIGEGRDLYVLHKDGVEVPVEISLNPIETDQGQFVLCAVVDITERKQAAELLAAQRRELERSNAELEQFAYVASHDLQEPLRMVVSFTELLEQRHKGKLDEKTDKFIRYIVEGGKRMQLLVSDLLAYSRVGRKGRPYQPVDTAEVARQVLADLGGMIAESGAEVVCGSLPLVNGDRGQLAQVFQNLVVNAIKFRSERAPLVRIGAESNGREWIYCVRDNGIGIEMQYADRLFQMFQRLHERGKYKGNGIGLALAKKIVEGHGGRIWFESEPGEGTAFYFTLPASRGGAP
jgi:PAS domain S-box-containing protein